MRIGVVLVGLLVHESNTSTRIKTDLCRKQFIFSNFPSHESALQKRDSQFHRHHHDSENEHSSIDAGRIEISLGLTDDPTQALRGGEIFSNDSAYKCESNRRVQA